ncbi:MAG: acyltransferase family protein [bacterium]|nr:acyltransferase family protein [bacterium]
MISYRRDIDGLRTLAVIPVILFHLGSRYCPGGYVGVDIFFVISGFLITATLKQEIERQDFSIIRFYERRARRILPALFFMVAATIIAGAFILMPDDFKDLGASATATALFASNILFWKTLNYFAVGAEVQPLVHTWSLAVEEQFYLLFPLFLAGLGRWGRSKFVGPTLALAVMSLIVSIIGVNAGSSAAYYLLPSRAWELLAGSLLALRALPPFSQPWHREVAAGGGLLAILGSIVLLNEGSPFPGLLAIPSVLGTVAILHAGTGGTSLVGRLLSTKPMVGIGLISYSLYLWHWPLIVYVRYMSLGLLSSTDAIVIFLATCVAAYLSWRYVERPFRNRTAIARKSMLLGSAIAIACAGLVGVSIYLTKGMPQRFPTVAELTRHIQQQRDEDKDGTCVVDDDDRKWGGVRRCLLTHGTGTRILLWGDSHALHYARGLRDLDGKVGGSIILYGMTGCNPILDHDVANRPRCRAMSDRVPAIIRQNRIQRVVLSGLWQGNNRNVGATGPGSLAATISTLKSMGVQVAIISDNPLYYFSEVGSLAAMARLMPDPKGPLYMPVVNDPRTAIILRRLVDRNMFFDPMHYLCKQQKCLAMVQGEPMTMDGTHFSRFGARYILAFTDPIWQ